jgi:Zinc knuckle
MNDTSLSQQLETNAVQINQLVGLVAQLATNTAIPSIEGQGKAQRSVKIDNPSKLDDGVNPTFDSWYLAMRSKFKVNADHFETEDARMYQVYVCTEGTASEYLYPRYEPDAADPFKTAQEMMTYLKQFFTNPHRVREARYEYQNLKMKTGESFFDFQTTFLRLANKAQIASSAWFDDMYDKLTLPLQRQLVTHRHTLGQDLHKLCELASGVDTENRRIGKLQAALAPKAPTQSLSKTFIPASTKAPVNKSFSPAPKQGSPAFAPLTKAPIIDPTTCFACGKPGHMISNCPQKKVTPELKEIANESDIESDSGKEYA